MYLQKSITTGHGVTADCWVINNVQTNGSEADGYTCSGNLSLYLDGQAYADRKVILDNCTFSYSGVTQEEVDGNTLQVIVGKITESVMSEDEEPVETNLLSSSHSGQIGFQDAIIA